MTGLVGHFHNGVFGLFDIRDCFVWLVKPVLQKLVFTSEPKLGETLNHLNVQNRFILFSLVNLSLIHQHLVIFCPRFVAF